MRRAQGVFVLTLALCAACAPMAVLEGRIEGLREIADQAARNGAHKCAPMELALAESHLHFAEVELAQGDTRRAEEHLTLAAPNARAALDLSPAEQCVAYPDRDGDGIVDPKDGCPEAPEDFDGVADEDGCPEDQDTDADGVADAQDLCPGEPEDVDGYLDPDGCPDLDNDADGVLDADDNCADSPEDPDGFADEDGCPDDDNDADTLADLQDDCPNEPGTVELRGCPKVYKDVEVTTTHIRITQKVFFATGKAKIMSRSFGLLSTVAQVMQDYPEFAVEVQGHTDDRGNARYNQRLSEARASAVRTYLIGRGVAPARMTARGYGEERPIESNSTVSGRATNRRVEFVRTDRAAVNQAGVPPQGEAPQLSP